MVGVKFLMLCREITDEQREEEVTMSHVVID